MLKTFPPKFVFSTKVESHKWIKENYLPKIKTEFSKDKDSFIVHNWNCKVYSSINHSLDFLYESKLLNEIVWNPIDQMLNEIDLVKHPTSSRISDIWFNVYEEGSFQEVHVHNANNTSFSGIYLMELNEPNTTTFAVNDQISYLNGRISTADIEEGSVILFPSTLEHYVNPCKFDRTTIAFNIQSEF